MSRANLMARPTIIDLGSGAMKNQQLHQNKPPEWGMPPCIQCGSCERCHQSSILARSTSLVVEEPIHIPFPSQLLGI
jgi:hypothetical protein